MLKTFQRVILFLGATTVCFPGTSASGPFLPISIEDNHAGSFYWFARNLDWTQKYHLILFDHHSDATAVFSSDFIRKILADRKDSEEDKAHFSSWKRRGIIQSFNWIEPLLPHPIYRVTWIPRDKLRPNEVGAKREEVATNINQYVTIAPRSSGDLSNTYTVIDFTTQKEILNFDDPVIVTIDLDYFVDTPDDQIESKFSELIGYVLRIKQLQAITVSISRQYLKSDDQADLLLFAALKHFSQIINAKIYLEPFTSYGPDRSELAQSYYKKGLFVPYYDLQKASSRLISLILQDPTRYMVRQGRKKWKKILERWSRNYKQPDLVLTSKGCALLVQSCNYFFYKDDFAISVNMPFHQTPGSSIDWKAYSPMGTSYNVLGKRGFADNDPKFVVFKEVNLSHLQNKQTINADQLSNLFDEHTGFGTTRVFAEITYKGSYYRTKSVCISKYANSAYTGKLTEIFNLPYILGSGVLNLNGSSGADAHYGADCLNFIIYGRRRLGSAIPYLNENNLRQYLTKIDDVLFFKDGIANNGRGKVVINPKLIHEGLLLHFGTHIAALYQDNDPKNILNDDDLVIHQLENRAEIIKLKELKQAGQPFLLMKFK